MSTVEVKSQSVSGFKVKDYTVKKSKEGEMVKLVLEALVDEVGAGEYDMGDVLKALLHHQVSDTDVGLKLLVDQVS